MSSTRQGPRSYLVQGALHGEGRMVLPNVTIRITEGEDVLRWLGRDSRALARTETWPWWKGTLTTPAPIHLVGTYTLFLVDGRRGDIQIVPGNLIRTRFQFEGQGPRPAALSS
jgi:hypothetical protein